MPDYHDVRDSHRSRFGSALRDAAVEPESDDFLAPINAGDADPHGPEVVAPEIHHEGPKGLKPGDVHVDDPAAQEADESALAEAVLVDNMDKNEAMQAASDEADDEADATPDDGTPHRNASKADWQAFAIANGMDEAEAEAASRSELIEKYG